MRPDITHVSLVTNSEDAYTQMRAALPPHLHTRRLYRDYLRSFRLTDAVRRRAGTMNIELREFQQEPSTISSGNCARRRGTPATATCRPSPCPHPPGPARPSCSLRPSSGCCRATNSRAPPGRDVSVDHRPARTELADARQDAGLLHGADPGTLTVLDAEFDAEQLAPGQVYFLNTQKLGKNSTLIATGDRRQFSLWETLDNTARARPGAFYVIIDEAHRGMAQSAQARNEANCHHPEVHPRRSRGQIAPVPLIVGHLGDAAAVRRSAEQLPGAAARPRTTAARGRGPGGRARVRADQRRHPVRPPDRNAALRHDPAAGRRAVLAGVSAALGGLLRGAGRAGTVIPCWPSRWRTARASERFRRPTWPWPSPALRT